MQTIIFTSLHQASAAAAGGEGEPKEPEKPLTYTQKAEALLPELLSEAAEASKQSIALEGKELSDDLVDRLARHSVNMQGFYRKLRDAAHGPEEKVEELMTKIKTAQNWYVKKSKAAKALLRSQKEASAPSGTGNGGGRGRGGGSR